MADNRDCVMVWSDLWAERPRVFRHFPPYVRTYVDYLSHLRFVSLAEELPPLPGGTLPVIPVRVNHGRWGWVCPDCNAFLPVEPDEPTICPHCADGVWMAVTWPAERVEIEAELLRQPGHRTRSPVRNWRPGQSVAMLRERTRRADDLRAQGQNRIRALSIATPRIRMSGEILTASSMNDDADILDDLAGRNGVIQLEDSVEVTDGSAGDRYVLLPKGTTAQRPTSPAVGMLRWNATSKTPEIWNGTAWVRQTFFVGGEYREYDTAGAHTLSWPWDTVTGAAIIVGGKGGDGGGGGGGGSEDLGFGARNAIGGSGGSGQNGFNATRRGSGAGGEEGGQGGDGSDSEVSHGSITRVAGGGRGGLGGGGGCGAITNEGSAGAGGGRFGAREPIGGSRDGPAGTGADAADSTGLGGAGGIGVGTMDDGGAGGNGLLGTAGDIEVVTLTGLALNTAVSIVVGAGGTAGDYGRGGEGGNGESDPGDDGMPGDAGSAGYVLIFPTGPTP